MHDVQTAFNLPYIYDYVTNLCRQQAKVIQNQDNEHVRSIGQGEIRRKKYKRLTLGGGEAYDRSSCTISKIDMICFAKESRDSSVGIETGYGLDDQEGREFESR
jgi:hypothetical protein